MTTLFSYWYTTHQSRVLGMMPAQFQDFEELEEWTADTKAELMASLRRPAYQPHIEAGVLYAIQAIYPDWVAFAAHHYWAGMS